MEEKQKVKLFREKSLDAIESPESLNDYLHVTSVGVWLVMAAVIAHPPWDDFLEYFRQHRHQHGTGCFLLQWTGCLLCAVWIAGKGTPAGIRDGQWPDLLTHSGSECGSRDCIRDDESLSSHCREPEGRGYDAQDPAGWHTGRRSLYGDSCHRASSADLPSFEVRSNNLDWV